jgi:glycine cleavage system H protein
MAYPSDRHYTKDHEWAKSEGDVVVVGITHHAQDSLGDIVFVDLTVKPGDTVEAHQVFGAVESTKATSDLFSPVGGTVVAVNGALSSAPETVNTDPHGAAWMLKLKPSNPAELTRLFDAAQYDEFVAKSGH